MHSRDKSGEYRNIKVRAQSGGVGHFEEGDEVVGKPAAAQVFYTPKAEVYAASSTHA
jgi:hypothetical protein